MGRSFILIAFIAGIAIFTFYELPRLVLFILAFVIALTAVAGLFERFFLTAALVVIAFSVGYWRVTSGPIAFTFLEPVTTKLESVRDSFNANLGRALPEPEASYMAGLLTGVRTSMPADLQGAFRKTGTSHLTALSGYNVTVITQYLGRIVSRLWFPIGGVVLFVLATGAKSSLVRAALMGALVLVAQKYGHSYKAGNALLFAVALMLFFDPSLLFQDVGFQLSIIATWGLIVFSGRIAYYVRWIPTRFGLRDAVSTTLAAQLATLPLILFYFGKFSLWSPLANILVIIAVPLTMLFGFLAGSAGYVHNIVASIAAWPAFLLLRYQLELIQFFATI